MCESRHLPAETLIIFDKIQKCPTALNALKYFREKANEYYAIAAGKVKKRFENMGVLKRLIRSFQRFLFNAHL